MNIIDSIELIEIFDKLNSYGLNYALLRNINKELPSHLEIGKDIDILVKKNDERKFINFFHENGYETIEHPFRNDTFLYGVDTYEYKYKNDYNKILFDLNFQLAVRSLEADQWIPLDQAIQSSAWKNIQFEKSSNGFGCWCLGYEDEFVTLIARSIFDKREFQQGYIGRIKELLKIVDIKNIVPKLEKIFFKFTPYLIKQLQEQEFSVIIESHMKFRDY